jgi:DNA ligase D
MADSAVEIEVSGRTVRVTSPDREIFPASPLGPSVSKQQVVEYYAAVGEPMMVALRERPTTLERWPKGVFEGAVLSTRQDNKGDAFFQKRIPAGAPNWVETARIQFPSGRFADEVCPTEPAVLAWAAQMGTIVFHPWPVRRRDVDHPDELRIDLDPQPGTDFADAVRVAGEARGLLAEIDLVGYPKTSGGRGLHIYVRIQPRWSFTDVRHAAIAFGRELERRMPGQVTTQWWKEQRGETVFVDYNQNARDRTIASAYSLRPRPGAPVSTPLTWDEVPDVDPRELTLHTVPGRVVAGVGNPMASMDAEAFSLETLLEWYERDGRGDMPYPPDYPKMPGEPPRVQPSRKNPLKWENAGQ